MGTTTRNGIWKIPESKQRKILSMAEQGVDVGLIAKWVDINRQCVEVVIEHGMVCTRPLRTPKRCPGCGSKIVVAPCLGCEMTKRQNFQRKAVSA